MATNEAPKTNESQPSDDFIFVVVRQQKQDAKAAGDAAEKQHHCFNKGYGKTENFMDVGPPDVLL